MTERVPWNLQEEALSELLACANDLGRPCDLRIVPVVWAHVIYGDEPGDHVARLIAVEIADGTYRAYQPLRHETHVLGSHRRQGGPRRAAENLFDRTDVAVDAQAVQRLVECRSWPQRAKPPMSSDTP